MSGQRDQFCERVQALVAAVEGWVAPHEWVTKRYPKKLRDESRQLFLVDALFLQKGPVRVLLDPVAYDVPGTEGLVDLYLMPTYDDMASLSFVDGRWLISYAGQGAGETVALAEATPAAPLDETSLNLVLDSIFDHAEPTF